MEQVKLLKCVVNAQMIDSHVQWPSSAKPSAVTTMTVKIDMICQKVLPIKNFQYV